MGPPIEWWCEVSVEMGPPIERRCQVSNPLRKRNPPEIYKLSSCPALEGPQMYGALDGSSAGDPKKRWDPQDEWPSWISHIQVFGG